VRIFKNINHNLFAFALLAALAAFPVEATYALPQPNATEWILQETETNKHISMFVSNTFKKVSVSDFWLWTPKSYLKNYNHTIRIHESSMSKKRLSIKVSEKLDLVLLPNFSKEDIS